MKTKMKRRQTRALKTRRRCLLKSNPSQSSYKVRSKMPSTAPREVKQVTAVEFELISSKIAATRQKNKSDKSSTKSLCKKIALRRGGEESEYRSSTRKVTEKRQAITGRFAACLFCTNCSLQNYTHVWQWHPSLHKVQPPDQGGFRLNHQTVDHVMVYRVLEQRFREWSVPRYTSTIDFAKALDRIKHSALWSSLEHHGIKLAYVKLLQRLCKHQEGTVLTDKESDVFSIKRSTKQGDPLLSLLFDTVLQSSLEDDLKRWQEKPKGIRLSDKKEDCLTNFRFADDVLLFSTSLEKLKQMLCVFERFTEAVGLGTHSDKPKILSNQEKEKKKEITVDNIKMKVLSKRDSAR